MDEITKKVEAILFSFGDFIEINRIREILNEKDDKKILKSIKILEEKYNKETSFKITNETKRVKMGLKEEYENLASMVLSKNEIGPKMLKTLSIIAYEGPITKTALNRILGRATEEDIAFLNKNNFISYQKKGIGKYYRVSSKFYDYFNIAKGKNLREELNKKLNDYIEN